jgi:hypothetical protein
MLEKLIKNPAEFITIYFHKFSVLFAKTTRAYKKLSKHYALNIPLCIWKCIYRTSGSIASRARKAPMQTKALSHRVCQREFCFAMEK